MTTSITTGTEDRSFQHLSTTDRNEHQQPLPVRQRRLVALDVDGTLLDHDGHMSDAVRDAAGDVVAAGHHVVIATGRSLHATLPVIERIGLARGFAVCSNGGVTVRVDPDLPDGFEVVERVTFDPAPALAALRAILPNATYALEDDTGRFLSTERFQDASFGVEAQGVDFARLLNTTAVRLVVYSATSTPDDFAEAITQAGLHGVAYSVGWTAWLDIAAQGTTKASALEQVRCRLDVDPALTVAMGDGRNDIEMLGWAGHGVVMGQAPAEVVAAADAITGTVDEDGAAVALRALLG
ncbi:HAD family hydrolase [Tersicoccus phoenicis]|uniref:HAD family hydrolase n=1 Tax=Tersicoccus phoenicis TaxID=554083 RepID=UPI000A05D4E2|nr:HAD family hydrolase [Tersicoccus phoenicis]